MVLEDGGGAGCFSLRSFYYLDIKSFKPSNVKSLIFFMLQHGSMVLVSEECYRGNQNEHKCLPHFSNSWERNRRNGVLIISNETGV